MAEEMHEIVEKLNDLIALDIDAVNAYEAAIGRMNVPVLRERLRQFQQDHERHIRELSQAVMFYAGEPRQRPDAKGYILKGFTSITAAMGDEAALRAMHANEQLTTRTYQKALEKQDWPADVATLIARNYADEQRHLASVEDALQNRSWKQAV